MREFRYRSTFATKTIRLIYPEEKNVALAKASLESLKGLLPANLNIGENPDLLFNSFNAAVANRINLNDDGILSNTAIQIYKKFVHKFCDLEHERSSIVGFIINSGLSEFMTNRLITEVEAATSNAPFNIALGGVVWTVADPQFAEMLVESSDETSPHYQEISASWEIGFDQIYLAVGSRDLSQAELITDPQHISELQTYLRSSGGTGRTKENEPIYRVITGEALPLGIGYTTAPAADVKGIIVANPNEVKEAEQEELVPEVSKSEPDKVVTSTYTATVTTNPLIPSTSITFVDTPKINDEKQKVEKISSQEDTTTVNNISNMKLTRLEDITDDSIKELSAAAVKNFVGSHISEELDKASTEYANNLEAKEQELKARKIEAAKFQADIEKAQAELANLTEELRKEKEVRAAEKAQADFNSRMADLDTHYDLVDADRTVIAKRIKGLEDEAYNEWLADFEVLAAAKKKQNKNDDQGADEDQEDKQDKKKSSKASIEVEQALDETKEEPAATPPNTPSVEKSIRDEFAEAFKVDDFKIRLRR